MRVEAGAETVQEADRPPTARGAVTGRGWSRRGGLPEGCLESPKEDVEGGGGGPGSVVKEEPQALGHRQDELADRDMGEDLVHHMGSRLGHAPGLA